MVMVSEVEVSWGESNIVDEVSGDAEALQCPVSPQVQPGIPQVHPGSHMHWAMDGSAATRHTAIAATSRERNFFPPFMQRDSFKIAMEIGS